MTTIYVSSNEHQTIFSKVGPHCPEYGKTITIWTLYNDGSYSYQSTGTYHRSKAGVLAKPRDEFSLNELTDIVRDNAISVNMDEQTSFELVYGNGGHSGPYVGLVHAKERARRLLEGCPSERVIYIVPRSANFYSPVYAVDEVRRFGACKK